MKLDTKVCVARKGVFFIKKKLSLHREIKTESQQSSEHVAVAPAPMDGPLPARYDVRSLSFVLFWIFPIKISYWKIVAYGWFAQFYWWCQVSFISNTFGILTIKSQTDRMILCTIYIVSNYGFPCTTSTRDGTEFTMKYTIGPSRLSCIYNIMCLYN